MDPRVKPEDDEGAASRAREPGDDKSARSARSQAGDDEVCEVGRRARRRLCGPPVDPTEGLAKALFPVHLPAFRR